MKTFLRVLVGAACGLLAAHAFAGAAQDDPGVPPALRLRIEQLIAIGFEAPARALLELQGLQRESAASPASQVMVITAVGIVEARSGHPARADQAASQLSGWAAQSPGGAAFAGAALVRAEAAFNSGQADIAAGYAEQALAATLLACPAGLLSKVPLASLPAPSEVPGCDWHTAWAAKRVLERQAEAAGLNAAATAQAQSTLRLLEWAGDTRRQSAALMSLARFAEERGERDEADRDMRQARRLAALAPEPAGQAQLESTDAGLRSARGELGAALKLRERAVELAASVDRPRLLSQMLTNLSDTYLRLDRPADALRTAEQGLRIVRSRRDLRAERTLINNAGIAKIALGRTAEGRQDLARLLDLWRSSGDTGREVETLREFGEALAKAGEPRLALELYHRERKLSDELMQANRKVALADLQARNDAQERQRDIELLARENALQNEALENRGLLRAIWALLSAVGLLACGVVFLRYRRGRRTQGRLAASHAELLTQSERDPLTNLANRRHFGAVMAGLNAGSEGLHGALVLVDIDHFKAVNDQHGHAGGDQALVEIAQRLVASVRTGDLVVRWGGEEFLVLAPHATAEQAAQMAARILDSVGATPVVAAGRALPLTVSIGHAAFPLPPQRSPLAWEAAVRLTDQALLEAKRRGRNRAVGIEATTLASTEPAQASPAGFIAASQDGRLDLRETAGPTLRRTDLQSA